MLRGEAEDECVGGVSGEGTEGVPQVKWSMRIQWRAGQLKVRRKNYM